MKLPKMKEQKNKEAINIIRSGLSACVTVVRAVKGQRQTHKKTEECAGPGCLSTTLFEKNIKKFRSMDNIGKVVVP